MWPNPHFPADFVTFIEEIVNGKLHFLCSKGWHICQTDNSNYSKLRIFPYFEVLHGSTTFKLTKV